MELMESRKAKIFAKLTQQGFQASISAFNLNRGAWKPL